MLRWQLFGTGFATGSPLSVQAFIRSDPAEARPDIQFQISHTSFLARPWFPGWRKGAGHQFTAGALLLDPESRGRVSLRSPDPADPPRILLNFLEAERDRAKLRAMIRFARRFFATAPASDLVAGEVGPGPEAESDEAIDAWNRALVMSGGHPTSTCAMGVGDDGGGRCRIEGARHCRPARRRRLGDAGIDPRQHQRAGGDDRGKGVGPHSRARPAAAGTGRTMMEEQFSTMENPRLEFAMAVTLRFTRVQMIPNTPSGGMRSAVYVDEGTFEGPRLRGRAVPNSGGDYAYFRPDDTASFDARYMLEEEDGTLILLRNRGFLWGGSPTRCSGCATGPLPAVRRCRTRTIICAPSRRSRRRWASMTGSPATSSSASASAVPTAIMSIIMR